MPSGRPLRGGVDRNTTAVPVIADVVALFTGAWIETLRSSRHEPHGESPSSRGRGSKRAASLRRPRVEGRPLHGGVDRNIGDGVERPVGGRPLHGGVDRNSEPRASGGSSVALFTGAWIEILLVRCRWPIDGSPPSRGRGSKLTSTVHWAIRVGSPSSRGRGSKHRVGRETARSAVALFTGAWIETLCGSAPLGSNVALFTGAWIETSSDPRPPRGRSPSSRGRGSKRRRCGLGCGGGRPLHGGVDRNAAAAATAASWGRPLHGGRGSKP